MDNFTDKRRLDNLKPRNCIVKAKRALFTTQQRSQNCVQPDGNSVATENVCIPGCDEHADKKTTQKEVNWNSVQLHSHTHATPVRETATLPESSLLTCEEVLDHKQVQGGNHLSKKIESANGDVSRWN